MASQIVGKNIKRETINRDFIDIEVNSSQSEPKELSRFHFFIILLGIFLGVFVTGIDETILSTSEEKITNELQSKDSLTWIATSYLMTMVVFTPLYGKFSDIFGRKVCMLFSLFFFSAGSLGCGLATNVIMLISFRAIAGIGGGGIVSVSYIIISDIVKMEDRAIYLGLISISFAISNMLGPILGGVIVDYVSWRFIFYINLPVAVMLAFIVIFIMPLPWMEGSLSSQLKRIDVFGSITLSLSIVLFVLGITWGGKTYPWTSYQVLLPLCFSLVSLISFGFIEFKIAKEPILPPKMFESNVIICCLLSVISGFNDFTIVYYLPIYYQILQGYSASQSGYELAPFLVCSSFVAMVSGFVCSRLQSFRIPIRVGTALMVVGSGLLCLVSPNLPTWCMSLFPIILAFGIGCCFQMTLVGAQASSKPEYIAILSSFFNFTFNFGATLGLAIDGAIINYFLTDFPNLLGDENNSATNLSPSITIAEHSAYYEALRGIFYMLLIASSLGFIISMLLKYRSLKGISMSPGH